MRAILIYDFGLAILGFGLASLSGPGSQVRFQAKRISSQRRRAQQGGHDGSVRKDDAKRKPAQLVTQDASRDDRVVVFEERFDEVFGLLAREVVAFEQALLDLARVSSHGVGGFVMRRNRHAPTTTRKSTRPDATC
jgi:hypothetical protein